MARAVTPTDRAIIRLLQRNARVSYAELSRATGIPESTVRRRMERLQSRGIIEFSMMAEPSKLGFDFRAIVGMRVDLPRLQEIAETLRGMNEVTFAAVVTGGFDIIAQVVVRSQDNLLTFMQQIAAIPGVRSTETFVMPLIIKPTTSWVLPETPDDQADQSESADAADADGQMAAPPVKRKRGRPRRNPVPA
jgi:Lrp/AsnC family transcriptional regulator, regulator for asnA, asnC and gidA